MNALSMIATFFKQGGPFMYIILGTGVAIVAIALERLWVISTASSLDGSKLAKDVVKLVAKGDLAAAAGLCRKMKAPAGKVALAIVTCGSSNEQMLNSAADGAATIVLPQLSRRLPYLSILANVATLLGLLGTVFGLITAFSSVGAADPSQRSSFLAAGISQALNTTALGLLIAVPTLVLHGFLVGKVEGIIEQVDEVSIRLIGAMTGRQDAV
jgi:biopolymer transport protein ExbB/TolQ